ncbi:uncharacterized protein HD556DRAFT_1269270 [Suillus plorans]|uniref:Uncharacterized protein n=1 Tax=Suillus plorans TaxID=116603 RepID=A0A9P7DJE1_9AGAM|nr:uncharacterized protein HD556DRAFT_1269270 [Suillus plorans]KAG1795395.1 hypothetical protein HD556DRAFT_1269270 [Suillus plorans]
MTTNDLPFALRDGPINVQGDHPNAPEFAFLSACHKSRPNEAIHLAAANSPD